MRKCVREYIKILATTNCNITKLCSFVGIDRNTYYKWYDNYEDFRNIVKYVRAEYFSIKRVEVENALFRRAMGYTVTNVTETEWQIISHKKHIPPCEKSLRYILKNFDDKGFRIKKTTKKKVNKKKPSKKNVVDDNLKIKKIKTPSLKIPQEVIFSKEEVAHIDTIDKLLNEYKKIKDSKNIWHIDNDIVIFGSDE